MTTRPARTTDKYRIVENRNQEKPKKNEIRITGVPRVSKYITYAAQLIKDKEPRVVLKGTGQAIKNVCLVAEILRNGIKGLHQLVEIKTASVVDEYHPKEEGLDIVKVTKYLPLLEISVFVDPVAAGVSTKSPGYQPPLAEVKGDLLERAGERRRGPPRGGRGRGRGRGRGFRGRGGYGYRSRGGGRHRSRSYSDDKDRRSRSRSDDRRKGGGRHNYSRSRSRSPRDDRDYKKRGGGDRRSRSRSGGRGGDRGGDRPYRPRGQYRSRGTRGGGYRGSRGGPRKRSD